MPQREKLVKIMEGTFDAILITSDENRLYMTGFDYSDGYALITKEKSFLITDSRYIEAAKKNANKGFEVVLFKGLNDGTIKNLLQENNVKKLGFEDKRVTVSEYISFKKIFDFVDFLPIGSTIENLREYKSESEVEQIIRAQRIAEKSLSMLVDSFERNMTEKELAAKLEYYVKINGGDGMAFNTIAVSGNASSLPHGVPRDVKLENGFLTIDFGVITNGYRSDMTRTFCIGSPDAKMINVYNTVLTAQNMAIDAIMNGERNCVKIDKVARDYIYSCGYEGCFGHGLGHGVGIEIHEAPRLSPSENNEKQLSVGHVVTVEPGIYIEGKYGVRIEDMIYIGENGAINLTKTPKNLIQL